ncbi:Cytochrome bd ubiquinol oxidase subunit 1 [compost metagenome]
MKMAASEALWETSSDPAPWTVFATIDPTLQKNGTELKVPYLLSVLSYSKLSGSVPGMKELQKEYEIKYGPGDYIPPVRTTFWSFRIMIAGGVGMILLSMYGVYLMWRKRLEQPNKWYWRMMLGAISLPFISNTAGWIMTEMGRQPWTVFGILRTEDSISPSVSKGQIWFSLISFSTIYLILLFVLIYLFVKTAKQGPDQEAKIEPLSDDPFDQEVSQHVIFK